MTNSDTPRPAVLAHPAGILRPREDPGGEDPKSAGAEPCAEWGGEAQRGEGTCQRMYRMGGRAGVRSDMPCVPGRCLVHRGCCRAKAACQRSLRGETERRAV